MRSCSECNESRCGACSGLFSGVASGRALRLQKGDRGAAVTFLSSVRYMLWSLCAFPIRIILNETSSSDHVVTGSSAVTVAARGALCRRASSPKAMPAVAFITEPLPVTVMSHTCRDGGSVESGVRRVGGGSARTPTRRRAREGDTTARGRSASAERKEWRGIGRRV